MTVANGETKNPPLSFSSEKSFQKAFVKRLKTNKWFVKEQVKNHTLKNRVDVLSYHMIFDDWFAFELKTPSSIKDYTKCLCQLIRYRKSSLNRNCKIFCFITPTPLDKIHYGFVIKRFFWRWGFGVGNYETMRVEFVNGEAIVTLDLDNPNSCYYSPLQQIEEIKKRSMNAWQEAWQNE